MRGSRAKLLGLCLVVCLCASGCMAFCPAPSPHRRTPLGEVRLLDYPTCRRMRVTAHKAERNELGRLVVTVRWLNRGRRPYKAEVRVRFVDEQGLPERGAFRWDLQSFPPGASVCEWTSYTARAARYRIEVRRAR